MVWAAKSEFSHKVWFKKEVWGFVVFKARLVGALSNLGWWKVSLPMARGALE